MCWAIKLRSVFVLTLPSSKYHHPGCRKWIGLRRKTGQSSINFWQHLWPYPQLISEINSHPPALGRTQVYLRLSLWDQQARIDRMYWFRLSKSGHLCEQKSKSDATTMRPRLHSITFTFYLQACSINQIWVMICLCMIGVLPSFFEFGALWVAASVVQSYCIRT